MNIESRIDNLERGGPQNFLLFDADGKVLWSYRTDEGLGDAAAELGRQISRAAKENDLVALEPIARAHHASPNFARVWELGRCLAMGPAEDIAPEVGEIGEVIMTDNLPPEVGEIIEEEKPWERQLQEYLNKQEQDAKRRDEESRNFGSDNES